MNTPPPLVTLDTSQRSPGNTATNSFANLGAEYLAQVVEQSHEGVWTIDTEGLTISINSRMAEMLGYSVSELMRLAHTDVMFECDRPAAYRQVELRKAGDRATWEQRYRRRDGTEIWTLACCGPLRDGSGKIVGALGMFTDITERRALEQSQKASERRFRETFENAAVGIAHLDMNGHWTLINDKLCEMLGYSRPELMALPFPEITHPADLAEDLDKTGRLMRGEISIHAMEKRYLKKTGEWLWVHLTGSMVRDDSGAPLYFVAVLEDISDRRRALEKLKESEIALQKALNAKDVFLAMVSHELRAPLSPILMLAQEAAHDSLTPEFLKGVFETIACSAEQQARIVDDLLDLSRIKAGTLACSLESLDIDLPIDDAVTSVAPAAAERKIAIRVERTAHRFVLRGDRDRLRQVFANLLGNAIKFSADGDAVTVRVSPAASSQVCVEIRDSGLGMTAEELSRLFEKFTQGDNVRREAKRYGGLGLGLSISKTIVELHSGTISATSAGRGLGSIFKVMLPVVRMTAV